MSLERGTYISPILWFSSYQGSTPIRGVRRESAKGFARQGRRLGEPHRFPQPPYLSAVSEEWRVPLPAAAQEPFEVFVNGVLQRRGSDYEVRGRELVFRRALAKEGRLGVFRWLSIFLGVAGTYRKNDSVDVVFDACGRRTVVSSLPIFPPS
jgi:hypothetical protein